MILQTHDFVLAKMAKALLAFNTDSLFFNSCAFFLLDTRTFFWHFSAKTRITEISVATDHQKHVV